MKTLLSILARQSANNWPSTTRDFAPIGCGSDMAEQRDYRGEPFPYGRQ
jgi:hypothetical protein